MTDDGTLRDEIEWAGRQAVKGMAYDWPCPVIAGRQRRDCMICVAKVATDALLPIVAAHIRAAERVAVKDSKGWQEQAIRAEAECERQHIQAQRASERARGAEERAEKAEAAIERVQALPRRPWDEDHADGVAACSARAYNSGLADCLRTLYARSQ